jgi:hypothetical protein
MAKRAKRGAAARRRSVKDLSPEPRKGRTVRGGKTAFPDVVKVPPPSGPIAIPYPN